MTCTSSAHSIGPSVFDTIDSLNIDHFFMPTITGQNTSDFENCTNDDDVVLFNNNSMELASTEFLALPPPPPVYNTDSSSLGYSKASTSPTPMLHQPIPPPQHSSSSSSFPICGRNHAAGTTPTLAEIQPKPAPLKSSPSVVSIGTYSSDSNRSSSPTSDSNSNAIQPCPVVSSSNTVPSPTCVSSVPIAFVDKPITQTLQTLPPAATTIKTTVPRPNASTSNRKRNNYSRMISVRALNKKLLIAPKVQEKMMISSKAPIVPSATTKKNIKSSTPLLKSHTAINNMNTNKIIHSNEHQMLLDRRERNRKHARMTRIRKKALLQTLEESVVELKKENEMIRKLLLSHCPSASTISTKQDTKKQQQDNKGADMVNALKSDSKNKVLDESALSFLRGCREGLVKSGKVKYSS